MSAVQEWRWTPPGQPKQVRGGLELPAGPWDDEPDKVQWLDDATGLDCLAVRGPGGSWCGYVGVPPGHPAHGQDYTDLEDIDVHGELTFASRCVGDDSDPSQGICHVPLPGRPHDVWWLGFDCAHYMDLRPIDLALARDIPDWPVDLLPGGTYWTVEDVRSEVASLAAQLQPETGAQGRSGSTIEPEAKGLSPESPEALRGDAGGPP